MPENLSQNFLNNYMFYGDTSLQSITFPSDSKYFNLNDNALTNAPLEAISYCNSDNIIPLPPSSLGNQTITRFTQQNNNIGTPGKSILMVKRGEGWKYAEAGYNEVFKIMEMKEPRFDIQGDIFSTYDDSQNINHYQTFLRWEVPLSDLNAEGKTEVEVFRDGTKIADVEFSKPTLDSTTGYTNVTIKVNGQEPDFKGSFDYLNENGNYQETLGNMSTGMSFDANSKRIETYNKYDYTSWFTMVDEFDSPVLSEPGVPDHYTYTARMKPYKYTELVNYDDYHVDVNGLRYHPVDSTTVSLMSQLCVVYTAMSEPSMWFSGVYTLDEVQHDTEHKLTATEPHSDSRTYTLKYELDSDVAKQQGVKATQSSADYIVQKITAYEVLSNGKTNPVSSSMQPRGNSSGKLTILSAHKPEPGKRYQTITETLFRGTFGSRVVTIPGTPKLEIDELNKTIIYGSEEGHNHDTVIRNDLVLSPDVTEMGYNNEIPAKEDYFIGVWRTVNRQEITNNAPMRADERALASGEETVHHNDREMIEHTWDCPICNDAQGYSADSYTYTDHIIAEHPQAKIDTNYLVRMYVRSPYDKDQWMLAEAEKSRLDDVLTEIDNVGIDSDTPIYFNLQGVRVIHPRNGEFLIRVDRTGSHRIRYSEN